MPHIINGTTHFDHVTSNMDITINGTLHATDMIASDITIDGTLLANRIAVVDVSMTSTIGNSLYGTDITCSDLTLNGGAGFQNVLIDGLRTNVNPLVIDGTFVLFDIRGAVIGDKASSPAGVSLLDVTDLDGFVIEGTIYRSALHGAVFDACTNGKIDLNIIDPSAATDNTSDGVSLTGICDGLTILGAVKGAILQANNPRYGVDVGSSCTDIFICMDISGTQTGVINDQTTGEVEACATTVLGEEVPSFVIDGFSEANLAASQTASQLNRWLQGAQVISFVVAHPGSVIGISAASTEARTAGTATFEVFVNGTGIGLTCVLNGTDTTFVSTAQAAGLDPFVAGDRLDVRVTTDGAWLPVSADVEAAIMIAG